ncbi:hypothetical protein BBBOND_0105740 [Babesia bigemina]|uniref:Uncharacterized protein n=1 Tax=Babesia bigemina TaxID=5866 RepID=A0A061D970_BABBI|nr:hypothetical protein BBBOND_0105740 [Babesia bigemina]CDR94265.1 hypothetical protein BBBOND_0105740 [Babesia bigemina]|eukprot:XP_012766451.1 hypothetical protein BBBOND_0105740 [Babesia bigemina]
MPCKNCCGLKSVDIYSVRKIGFNAEHLSERVLSPKTGSKECQTKKYLRFLFDMFFNSNVLR